MVDPQAAPPIEPMAPPHLDFVEPALLMQSAGSGVAESYARAAQCMVDAVRESVDELNRCISGMLAAHNPFGVAGCYGTFLMRLGQRGSERMIELGQIMSRANASLLTAQVDGSRPSVADGAPDSEPGAQRAER